MRIFDSIFEGIKNFLMGVLPLSPFRQYVEYLAGIPYLGWLNWFVPFDSLVSITVAWLSCITLHYAYQFILRWAKIIQ